MTVATPPDQDIAASAADRTGGDATSTDPTAAALWSRWRAPLLIATLALVAAATLAYLGSRSQHGVLDPRSPDPQGSMALARLLADHGVDTQVVTSPAQLAAAGADSTVFAPTAASLNPAAVRALGQTSADLDLAAPDPATLRALAPGVRAVSDEDTSLLTPACSLRPAQDAGQASVGGVLFDASQSPAPSVGCYPDGPLPSLLRLEPGARTVTLLGAAEAFRNDHLASAGNAALALGLLGGKPHLLWYLPPPPAEGNGSSSLMSLLPAGWRWATLQVGIGVALLALWRMRRLGPVVPEPLPVRVRATETVQGRGRLYRQAHARAAAADALRVAAVNRLRPLVGAGAADTAAVVAVVAARTGRPEIEVSALLAGPAPPTDAALIDLAYALDAVEKEVRHP